MRIEPYKAPSNDLMPYLQENRPVFRCHVNAQGSWYFRCTCGDVHVHGPHPGHRVGHCKDHGAGGYFLIDPDDDETLA